MRPFDPGFPHPRLHALLAEYPSALFSQSFHEACRWTDRYAEEWALEIAHRLGLGGLGSAATPEQACEALGFQPSFARALRWVVATLAEQRLASSSGNGVGAVFELSPELPASCLAEVRATALSSHPELAPTFDLFDAAGAIYADVAHGRKQGDAALFGLGQASLWIRYFDNANPVYAINNRVAAHHAATFLERFGRPARILELGAGAGSATEALLEELERRNALARVGRYDVTEPSSFFRRQGERRLASRFPAVPLTFGGLDMNTSWETQGFADGTWDLIFGVNVLHVAANLAATLARIGARLASDGLLVAGEAMRLAPGVPLAAELIFSILEGFTQVELDAVLRPEPGFLSPDSWRRSLAAAGFRSVRVAPDLAAITPLFPRFGVGVMLAAKGDSPCPE